MEFTQEMRKAFMQGRTGITEFLTLWAEQLPPDRLAQLMSFLDKGLRLGLQMTTTGAPEVNITLTDAAGGMQVLQSFEFRDPCKH